jgi:polyisoprenoid-binding protein YceI
MRKKVSLAVLIGTMMSTTLAGAIQPPVKTTTKTPVKAAAPSSAEPKTSSAADVRFTTAGDGNKARYRVRERLVGKELDNDAIGETPKVSGTIALDNQGRVIATESGFTANVSLLKSDEPRRDRYVRNRILLLDSFPVTTFRATEVRGLAAVPKSGQTTFQLIGDLTVKGVTRTSLWTVTATVNGEQLTGQAVTRFTFKEFGLLQPRVPVLMSVADTIALEYDFVMQREQVVPAVPAKPVRGRKSSGS